MSYKAVFLDRDNTLIEDPGYISDPSLVKLLPGVEQAVRSLSGAGYKIVVVTNQSGIARGLLTEETLAKIHAEMTRQVEAHGVKLDGVYYCPFHPEGTVERYAVDSDLRKPKPGMLLQAARDLDIDLRESWMVGDSPRDIEAGQRAGCRTIRIHSRPLHVPGEADDEDAQPDFSARNIVEAARIIVAGAANGTQASSDSLPPPRTTVGAGGPPPVPPPVGSRPGASGESGAEKAAVPPSPCACDEEEDDITPLDGSQVQREILRSLRRIDGSQEEYFSLMKLAAGAVQVVAILAVLVTAVKMTTPDELPTATVWGLIAVALQVMALTFFTLQRNR
jgi:D-glycero-D-manno-heptose 1,7-bisphosphate phosphatase